MKNICFLFIMLWIFLDIIFQTLEEAIIDLQHQRNVCVITSK